MDGIVAKSGVDIGINVKMGDSMRPNTGHPGHTIRIPYVCFNNGVFQNEGVFTTLNFECANGGWRPTEVFIKANKTGTDMDATLVAMSKLITKIIRAQNKMADTMVEFKNIEATLAAQNIPVDFESIYDDLERFSHKLSIEKIISMFSGIDAGMGCPWPGHKGFVKSLPDNISKALSELIKQRPGG